MARILVIDDEAEVRESVQRTLASAGHEVMTADDGREGVKLCRQHPFDVVITDLYMPNQEGMETLDQLRRGFPNTRTIAMTGKAQADTMLAIARKLGAVEVLQKAFDAEQLLAAVEKALTQPPKAK